MEIQMCWLHELVHEVNGVWLLLTNQLTPTSKEIVYFQTTVLLVSIVQHPPVDTTAFLFDNNEYREELYHPARCPPETPVDITLFGIAS